jgi:hypothetical protein
LIFGLRNKIIVSIVILGALAILYSGISTLVFVNLLKVEHEVNPLYFTLGPVLFYAIHFGVFGLACLLTYFLLSAEEFGGFEKILSIAVLTFLVTPQILDAMNDLLIPFGMNSWLLNLFSTFFHFSGL